MGKRKSKKKSSSSQSQPQHSESEKKRKNNKNDTFFLVDHKRKKKKYESSKHSNTPIVLMEIVVLSFIPTYLLLRNFRFVNRNFAIMAMHAIEKYQFSDHFYVSDKKLENLSQDEVHNLFTKFHSCKRMTVQGDMHCVHSMELPFHKLQNLTYLDCYDIPVSFSEEIIQSNLVNTLVKLKIFTIFTNMPLLLRLKNLQDLSVKLDDSDDLKPLNLEGVLNL
ncbi:hypothetical protein C9374_002947 [Naegleria lovaniensis]|uniref:Uncharacterized protein n=1 Tax=Naegleria lovaniensis TaxID=51637 RepID=A0AA88GTM0_NAELO|nr:uncharacterized protein C9374_002947 [Naegleria lovaniensis]KAG2385798.1 hypothetical protein C9374_002947 [Naegleria lovaniensis]